MTIHLMAVEFAEIRADVQRHLSTLPSRIDSFLEYPDCRQKELHPIAGCWYYNHNSKKTLERAGMVTQTRLLKVDY